MLPLWWVQTECLVWSRHESTVSIWKFSTLETWWRNKKPPTCWMFKLSRATALHVWKTLDKSPRFQKTCAKFRLSALSISPSTVCLHENTHKEVICRPLIVYRCVVTLIWTKPVTVSSLYKSCLALKKPDSPAYGALLFKQQTSLIRGQISCPSCIANSAFLFVLWSRYGSGHRKYHSDVM